jgi:hypothetical protein
VVVGDLGQLGDTGESTASNEEPDNRLCLRILSRRSLQASRVASTLARSSFVASSMAFMLLAKSPSRCRKALKSAVSTSSWIKHAVNPCRDGSELIVTDSMKSVNILPASEPVVAAMNESVRFSLRAGGEELEVSIVNSFLVLAEDDRSRRFSRKTLMASSCEVMLVRASLSFSALSG